MKCPVGPWDLCGDQLPCPVCPHTTTLPTRAVVLDTVWDYTREDGWHEPEGVHARPASQESCEAEHVGHLTQDKRDAPGILAGPEGVAPPTGEVV